LLSRISDEVLDRTQRKIILALKLAGVVLNRQKMDLNVIEKIQAPGS
jgi:hypothetical protein